MAAMEQQYCLKWNNHRSTLFSVFDTLLEEESLVDVTLSAEGQFLRAHRVILSACSPYFRNLFKSGYLNDKHPVVFMKDMEFENLKSLVEYMYKGEANVPQPMLDAFIKDAQSLEIRGLAECANKQIDLDQLPFASPPTPNNPPTVPRQPAAHSTPLTSKKTNGKNSGSGSLGILASRLAKMTSGGEQVPNMPNLFDINNPESLSSMFARNPSFLAAAAAGGSLAMPPAMKKPRKSTEPRPRGGSPIKDAKKLKKQTPQVPQPPIAASNNNYGDDEEGGLKIDEDADPGKENLENKMDASEDIAEIVDNSNGVSEEEEEPSMPGPGGELAEAASIVSGDFINPWTGGKLVADENEDNSAQDGVDVPMFSSPLMDTISSLNNGRGQNRTGTGSGNSSVLGTPDAAPERDLSTNKYCCGRCGRSYQHQATLVRHQRYECGIQASYPCDICNRKFKRRDVLKGHKEKCVNKVQAQAALASMASVAAGSSGGGSTTPRALSPSAMAAAAAAAAENVSGFRPELHHNF